MRLTIYHRTLVMLCLLIGSMALAQERSYYNYSVKDGLGSNTVYEVFQDSRGFIWIATESGVSIFDGYKFKNLTSQDGLPDNEIFGFFEDSQKRIWFRTFNGRVGFWQEGVFHTSANDSSLVHADFNHFITNIF